MRTAILLAFIFTTITITGKNNKEWFSLSTDQLMDMGRQYIYDQMPDSALFCFDIVGQRYKKDASICNQYMRAMVNSGIVYSYHYHDYPKAFHCLTTASDLAREYKNDSIIALSMVNMVDLMTKYYQDYPSASVMIECRKLATAGFFSAYKSHYWPCLVMNFINIADSDTEIDLTTFSKLFDKNIPDSVINLQYARNLYRAIEASQKGDYAGARKLIRANFTPELYSLETERYYINNYRHLCNFYVAEKRYNEALAQLDSALVLIEQSQQTDVKARVYLRKSDIYKEMGDSVNVKRFYSLYLEARDKLNRLGKLQSLLELNFLHEINLDTQEMEKMQDRQSKLIHTLILSGLVMLLLATLCIIIYRQKRRLQDLNKSLYEHIQNELTTQDVHTKKEETLQQSKPLDNERMDELWQRILQALDDTELICSPEFSQSSLANAVGSNVKYVSIVVNERSGKNFTALLNEHRMKEAARRMNDTEKYGNYTVEAISQSLGFKSRVTFINAFKRQFGLTPSEYMRIARQEHK